MPVRRLLSGALTAPLLILAGCGGSSNVADPPVSPSAASSSASPPQHETPQAFIRRWADADIAMQNSGDATTFRALSKGCRGCNAVARRVDAIYEAGGSIRTRGWSIVDVRISNRNGRSRTADLVVDSAPTTYFASKSAPAKHLEGGREHFQLQMRAVGSSWLVTQFIQVQS